MSDAFDRLLWAYRAVFTQTNAGGGNIVVDVTLQGRTVILYGETGRDDYAAARNVGAQITDGTNIISTLQIPSVVDNARRPLISPSSVAITDNAGIQNKSGVVVGRGDILQVSALALVQNETLTLAIRALLGPLGARPLVTTTGSTGTVTTTVTYNKVI